MDTGNDWVRIRVWFEEHLMYTYGAERDRAERFTGTLKRHFAGLVVEIDDGGAENPRDLRPLPSEVLWTVAL